MVALMSNSEFAQAVMVLANYPDREQALVVAGALVEAGLAAAVNVMAVHETIYRWRGKIVTGREVQLAAKTSKTLSRQAVDFIESRHPYDIPSIIVIPITGGSEVYLQWLVEPDHTR